MGFKKFLIWIIKNLIILLLATLIFSSVTLDLPGLITGVFGDIFAYASPHVQKQVINQLAGTCSSLEHGEGILTISQVCGNASLLESMKENCQSYRELKRRNIKIENEGQMEETCLQIGSGELERTCSKMQKSPLLPDFSKIGALCRDYKEGLIDDKEFFYNVISGVIPSSFEAPKIEALDKFNRAMDYLNKNRIVYFVVLAILFMALYPLIMDPKVFFLTLGGISLSLGLLIMLPYFAVLTYEKFVGFDTTPILGSMFGSENVLEPKSIISVILLMFLRTYNAFVIIMGIALLAAGTISKTYKKLFSKAATEKMPKTGKKSKKVDKLFGELKESMKKKIKNS